GGGGRGRGGAGGVEAGGGGGGPGGATPGPRREPMSSTEARCSLPSPVGISVPSPYHLQLIFAAGKSRLTRSGARHRPFPGPVVPLRLFFRRLPSPCWRSGAARVFLPPRQPASRRSAVIRGDPYLPSCSANKRATSALSRSRRCARGGNAPPRHL